MEIDSPKVREGTGVTNLTAPSGANLPTIDISIGELFYKTGAGAGFYGADGSVFSRFIYESELSAHAGDAALHLTVGQNSFLDAITVSSAEVNYLSGVTSNVQTQLTGKLNLSGGTMTGALTLSADPTLALHAATKQYVDSLVGGGGTVTSVAATAPAAGFTISGSPITGAGTLVFALADDLAALEGLSGTGLAVRSAANTWLQRTITGTNDQISVQDGNGVGGNPIISIADNAILPGTGAMTIPKGTTAQEPTPSNGMLRYDETMNKFRVVENGVWVDGVGGGGSSIFSDLAAATAANNINNGNHAQVWNWQLTTLNNVGLNISENAASTGANSKLVHISTLAGSTASPLLVSIGGQEVLHITDTGSISLVAIDDAGNNVSLAAGSGGTSSQGGVVSIAAGYAGTGSAPNRVGGSVSIDGGSGQNSDNIGNGGYVEIRGGGADPTQGNGGYVWMYGGNSDTLGGGGYVLIEGGTSAVEGNGGNVTLNGGNGAGTGTPGSLMLNGGTSDLQGGSITIQAGAAGGTDQSGGSVVIVSGDCTGNGGFSEVDIRSGLLDSGTMTASHIAVQTPSNDGLGNRMGGGISIQGGDGDDGATPEDAQGGGITITAGFGGLTDGNGGSISIYAGSAQGGNGNGGDAVIGAGTGYGSGQYGSVMLVANNTNVQLTGTGSLAHWHPSNTLQTTDTDGFLYIRGMAGVPTGTPTALGTSHALAWNSSGSALYVYDTAWHKLATVDVINIYTKPQISETLALTHNTAWDASDKQHLTVNVNGSAFTVANPTSQQNKAYYSMYIEFTTTHSVSFGSAFKGLAGYTPSATAGKKDHLTFRSDGTNLMCTGIATDIGA